MLKNFTLINLSFFIIVFTSSCTKNSVGGANAGGTSSYTFDGFPGTCATPTITGIYRAGLPLNATNTLTFGVNVSAEGTYSINTTTSNGVYFSGSGTFSTMGPQTLVLKGNGIPQNAGNFPFVPATDNTCNFSVSFLDRGPSAVFTYAGAPASCTSPVISGAYAAGITMSSSNYVDLAVNVTTPGSYTVSTNTANGISFSANGTFSMTGTQVIRLIGNGRPVAEGNFAFIPTGGCSFNIAVTPAPPQASFLYTCSPTSVSGTFVAGTALTPASTITIDVYVTVVGAYSVSTVSSNNNGVIFSGSGVFNTIGPQTITLTSINTPTAAGIFTYRAMGAGCFFTVAYSGGDFLKCTIDGVAQDFNTNLSGIFNGGLFNGDGDLGSSSLSISVIDVNGNPITTGTYNKTTLSNNIRYATASFLPDNSNPLASWQPFPLNSNPFTITIQTITSNNVTGIFAGDIFDLTGGNKKIITNGTFSISY